MVYFQFIARTKQTHLPGTAPNSSQHIKYLLHDYDLHKLTHKPLLSFSLPFHSMILTTHYFISIHANHPFKTSLPSLRLPMSLSLLTSVSCLFLPIFLFPFPSSFSPLHLYLLNLMLSSCSVSVFPCFIYCYLPPMHASLIHILYPSSPTSPTLLQPNLPALIPALPITTSTPYPLSLPGHPQSWPHSHAQRSLKSPNEPYTNLLSKLYLSPIIRGPFLKLSGVLSLPPPPPTPSHTLPPPSLVSFHHDPHLH